MKDLPPVSTVDINVQEPSIYFGELSNEYVIARTRTREFHYPKGDDNVFVDYAGSGGVVLDSLLKKLLFAVYFRSNQILLSDDITSESRLIFDRQIRRRVSKIAPFLVYDEDPYLVVSEGRLFWIQDAYTTASRYPYATEAARGVNYIRNSVKVVVDAYNGTTTFYLSNQLGAELQNIFNLGFLNEHSETRQLRKASPYLRTLTGGHALDSVANARRCAEAGFDGVVHLCPVGCMPEVSVKSILRQVCQDTGLALLELSFDEHTAHAGICTRLEAFVDVMLAKAKAKAMA